MQNEASTNPSLSLIATPWSETLLATLKQVQQRLLLVSPYIRDDAIALAQTALVQRDEVQPLEVRIITRMLPEELLAGSSDIHALLRLLSWSEVVPQCHVEMRAINNVHAKVWLCDTRIGLVGSGNATMSGLERNLEYGVAIAEPTVLEQMWQQWNGWWEQAAPVTLADVQKLQDWLSEAAQSDEVRQEREQRKAVERTLRTAPRIGKRLELSTPKKRIVREVTMLPTEQASSQNSQPISQHHPTSAVLHIAQSDFYHALAWTLPSVAHENPSRRQSHQRNAYLKLTWRPMLPTGQLTLTWADGIRLSQATITAQPTEQNDIAFPWAVTLTLDQIERLQSFLEQNTREDNGNLIATPQQVYLSPLSIGQLTEIKLAYHAQMQDARTLISTPGTPASNASPQRPPLSHITINHARLLEALRLVAQEWQQHKGNTHPLDIIEMGFFAEPAPRLVLSVGQLGASGMSVVPIEKYIHTGPPLRLRLDYPALQKIVEQTQTPLDTWQLTIDRNAESIQFVPHPPMYAELPVWRHELRHLEQ